MSEVRQRRGAPVDDAVLTATLELLARTGYEFTIEEVAESAAVHKTTIYRRWESKPILVAAAISRLGESMVVAEQTDDPIADLTALARQIAAALSRPIGRNPLRATLAAAGTDPELASIARDFFYSRYEIAVPSIARAQTAGLIDAGIDPILIWRAIVNPMHLDAICGLETSPEQAEQLVALVLGGASTAKGLVR